MVNKFSIINFFCKHILHEEKPQSLPSPRSILEKTNLSSGPLRSLRGPEKQGGDITRHWSSQSVFVEQISNFVTHPRPNPSIIFPKSSRTHNPYENENKPSGARSFIQSQNKLFSYRNRCEPPLRPQDGSFKALFSYIIDVEENTTPR